MRVIVYSDPDGSVSVVRPVAPPREGETEGDYLARIRARAVPASATEVFDCDETDIPKNRAFRGAWRLSGQKIAVDMPLARALKMDRIRAERDKRLADTDRDVAKLDGAAVPAPLRAKRQALRDIPQTVDLDAIADPDALERFEPAWP